MIQRQVSLMETMMAMVRRPFAEAKSDNGLLRTMKWNFNISTMAARSFVTDMHAYHDEKNDRKREEIAARQAQILNEHLPGARRLRSLEIAEVFKLMMIRS